MHGMQLLNYNMIRIDGFGMENSTGYDFDQIANAINAGIKSGVRLSFFALQS